MIKVVFLDCTGTITQEGGADVEEILRQIAAHSDWTDMQTIFTRWWQLIKEYEEQCSGEAFRTEDEIVDAVLAQLVDEIHLRADLNWLHRLCQRYWVYAPIFDDVKEFFDQCPVPIYLVTNNGIQYAEAAMKEHNLHPAGIVGAEMARAYKPHPALFRKALEVCGVTADEAIHVGDSLISDVAGAQSAGIRAILLNRKGKPVPEGIEWIATLPGLLELL